MSKLYKPLFSIFCSVSFFTVIAQPTLTNTNILNIGDAHTYYVIDSNAVNMDAVNGANVTWDYSSSAGYMGATSDNIIINAASGSHASSFPNSSIADELQGNLTIYKNIVNDSIYAQGHVFSEPNLGIVVSNLSIDNMVMMKYPFTYQDNFTDAFDGTVNAAQVSPVPIDYSGTISYIADGHGTMILPSGNTFSNVLRIKSVENSLADLGILGQVSVVRTVYVYYDLATSNFPIFIHSTLSASGTDITTVYSYEQAANEVTVGVEENNLTKISIYPNPAKDLLNIANLQNVRSVEVMDLTGKVVIKQNENFKSIDINKLNPGVYFVKVNSGNSSVTRKFLKK